MCGARRSIQGSGKGVPLSHTSSIVIPVGSASSPSEGISFSAVDSSVASFTYFEVTTMPGSSSSHSSLVMLASNLGDNDSDSCSMSLLFAVPWFGNAEFDCNCQDMGNPVPWRNGCRRGGPCRRGGAVGG
ncbi:Os03g0298900 [Oryza sativa Japonica Group]|uniref:Os03g0298900 protein n=2 Tax=Oryza TaxID=4527 RepID=C7IZV5_ORYSJ|nr:Os03g0298900 [Oryza sativa Japonica Group]|eukprot:NP_001173383.1 Os03g0298900 [Oryza sativa Japonica Group]